MISVDYCWVSTFFSTHFCCSVTQCCPTLCDPMDCSTPGLPVLHHLLELAQTHVHWDVLQPSHPLSKWCLCFIICSLSLSFAIAFLPRRRCLLISWLQSSSTVILEPKKRRSVTVSTFSTSVCMKCWDQMLVPAFSLCPPSPSSRGSLVPLHFLALEWYHLKFDISPGNPDSSLCLTQPGISHEVLFV